MSGGLDSSILVAFLLDQGCRVVPLYVRSGLRWEREELAAARLVLGRLAARRLAPLVTLDLPVGDLYGQHWSITGSGVPGRGSPDWAVYLPGRNALLVLKAALWCQLHGMEALALGVLASNPFADASAEFFRHLEAALNCSSAPHVRLLRPFDSLSKRQVMQFGRSLPLELTFSCIDPRDGLHCGQCNKCGERRAAFRMAHMDDPTAYAVPLPAG